MSETTVSLQAKSGEVGESGILHSPELVLAKLSCFLESVENFSGSKI